MRSASSLLAALVALGLLATGCGRLGFEITSDAGSDAGLDAGRDAGIDAALPRDVGLDAPMLPDAGCPRATNPCTELRALPAAPTIDGVIEPCLTAAPLTPVGWIGGTLRDAIHARAAYGWRPDGIYFYVEVDDPSLYPGVAPTDPYCGDGVEIYVDDDGTFATPMTYDVPGTMQLIAAAPASTSGTSTYGGHWIDTGAHGPWTDFAMVGRPGGYAMEALVRAADLGLTTWSLSAGQHVGLDLSINVSTPDGSLGTSATSCGVREGQFFLRIAPGTPACVQPFCNTQAFCTPVLR